RPAQPSDVSIRCSARAACIINSSLPCGRIACGRSWKSSVNSSSNNQLLPIFMASSEMRGILSSHSSGVSSFELARSGDRLSSKMFTTSASGQPDESASRMGSIATGVAWISAILGLVIYILQRRCGLRNLAAEPLLQLAHLLRREEACFVILKHQKQFGSLFQFLDRSRSRGKRIAGDHRPMIREKHCVMAARQRTYRLRKTKVPRREIGNERQFADSHDVVGGDRRKYVSRIHVRKARNSD